MDSVERAYGALTAPSWRFAEREYRRDPYSATIERLREFFVVEETADLNDDVSCVYYLRNNSGRWVVYLSLVGKFAAVMVVGDQNRLLFDTTNRSRDIKTALSESGVTIVPVEIMSTSVRFGAGDSKKVLFSLIFSDVDELPWER